MAWRDVHAGLLDVDPGAAAGRAADPVPARPRRDPRHGGRVAAGAAGRRARHWVSIGHDFSPSWPLIGGRVARLMIGEFFVRNIAGKTLRRIKELAEAEQARGRPLRQSVNAATGRGRPASARSRRSGLGRAELWRGVLRERSAVRRITRFDPSPFRSPDRGRGRRLRPARLDGRQEGQTARPLLAVLAGLRPHGAG